MKRKEKNQFSENVTSLQQKKKKKKIKVKISLDRIIINQLHYMLTFTNNKNINIRVFFFIFFSKWILLSLTLKVISYTNCYKFQVCYLAKFYLHPSLLLITHFFTVLTPNYLQHNHQR